MKSFLALLLIATPAAALAQNARVPTIITPTGVPYPAMPMSTWCSPDGQTWAPCGSASTTSTVMQGATTDGSGTITTGGTSQAVFASNPTRHYLSCQNPITANETLFFNLASPASANGSSFELPPGGSVSFAGPFVPSDAVAVSAATTGHRFICKQG